MFEKDLRYVFNLNASFWLLKESDMNKEILSKSTRIAKTGMIDVAVPIICINCL